MMGCLMYSPLTYADGDVGAATVKGFPGLDGTPTSYTGDGNGWWTLNPSHCDGHGWTVDDDCRFMSRFD